ncbi:SUKH-3 domain-containing protein [Peristeroidobacter agariperforans]|uniref:SUKH-3 domain-containing protein n=1 Tax=Peristeroidobacter agariperforans TaxID=268404 RepID=UPI00130074E5|nr:SUKH-3 domain-containing protein [Peristeroidobacter agariperforans]
MQHNECSQPMPAEPRAAPPATICSMFEQAGWVPDRQMPVSSRVPNNHPAYAVLSSFSGLRVGSTEGGIECAASDIEFRDEESQMAVETRWSRYLNSQIIFVGYQHNEHGTLFIDSRGHVYGASLIHEAFWLDGEDVWSGIENVLLGRRSRPVLHPTQSSVTLYGELYVRGDPRIFSP